MVTTAYCLKDLGLPEGLPTSQIFAALGRSVGLRYLELLLLGGAAIYVGVPRILEELGCSCAVAFAAVFSVFNFHHFMMDRAIWRLRYPRVRQVLLA